MDYNSFSDEELKKQLEDGILIEELENTEGWKIIKEACQRVSDKAMLALLKAKATDTALIIELQQVAKLYSTVLPSLLRHMKAESRLAFDELMDRGANLTE